VERLIGKSWKRDCWRRPTFDQILDRLGAMQFKLTANVNLWKLFELVKEIKDWEETLAVSAAIAH
jgi:hypothetical protein